MGMAHSPYSTCPSPPSANLGAMASTPGHGPQRQLPPAALSPVSAASGMAHLLPTCWLRCSQVSIGTSYSTSHAGVPCPSEPNSPLGEGRPRTVTGAQTCNTALCCLVFLEHGFPEAQELYSPTSATTQPWSGETLHKGISSELCGDKTVTVGFHSALSRICELSRNGTGHAPAQP